MSRRLALALILASTAVFAMGGVGAEGGLEIGGVSLGATRESVDIALGSRGLKSVVFAGPDKTVHVYCYDGSMICSVLGPWVVFDAESRVVEVWNDSLTVDGKELDRKADLRSVIDRLGPPARRLDIHRGDNDYRLFVYDSKGLVVQARKHGSRYYPDCFKLCSDTISLPDVVP